MCTHEYMWSVRKNYLSFDAHYFKRWWQQSTTYKFIDFRFTFELLLKKWYSYVFSQSTFHKIS